MPTGEGAMGDVTELQSRPAGGPLRLLAIAATVAVLGGLAAGVVQVSLLRRYGLDEFQYAHAGWRIARGEAIYRDFFEHHFPLLHDLLAVVWRFLPDDPDRLHTLRWLMLPAIALAVVATAAIQRRDAGRFAFLAAAPLLMAPTLVGTMIEVRPDALGGALYLAALAALYPSSWAPRTRGIVSGVLFGLALWTTLKVAYHGLPFAAAFVADLAGRRRGRKAMLGDPWAFAVAAAVIVALGVVRLAAQGAVADWWRWCVAFSFTHQRVYPGFPWIGNVEQLLQHSAWLVGAAAVGTVVVVRRLRRDGGEGDPDWLLLGALPASFVSFAWQSAPYLYSLVPFTLVLAVLAGRAIVAVFRWAGRPDRPPAGPFVAALLVLLLGGELARTATGFSRLAAEGNADQRLTLARLGQLTEPTDPVFHVWGGQIARPAVHYFYFQEAVTMLVEDARLRRELVPAMVEKGVTVYLHHDLFPRLVPELRHYLRESFVPLDDTIWIYGRRFHPGEGGAVAADFTAVRAGRYFVSPPSALSRGASLQIDGSPIPYPIFELERGSHRIEYRGPAPEIAVVWMPRDGRIFVPRSERLPEP